jgi:UDP-glucose 4-epimerase
MKVFVTGGTGFIGSYVVMMLRERGHEVTILARNPDKVPALREMDGVEIVGGFMADFEVIEEHLPGHQACIHVALCWGESAYDMLMNDTRTSVFLCEKAAGAGVEHFIYTSSTAALGAFRPDMTEHMQSWPVDYYCATKRATEQFVLAVSHKHAMRVNVVRPGYTFGNPVIEGGSMEGDRRFRDICAKARAGEEIVLGKDDGTQFIWAGDLARVYGAVLDSDRNREIYHGLSVPFVSWAQIAGMAVEMADSDSSVKLEGEGGDPYLFDLSKIREHFGLAFDPTERLREHVRYLLDNPEA